MRIVILDGHTMNPGDLDWSELAALGELTVYPRTAAAELLERAREAEILMTNKTPLAARTIRALPRLRYIGILATGTDAVDIRAASAAGIQVTNVPGYSTESVAQHVFALLFELIHRVGHHAETVRSGRWSASPDFCYWDYPLRELGDLTLGIVGFGAIGRAVGARARAFGMRLLVERRPSIRDPDIELVSREECLRRCDVLTLHCPLNPETEKMINEQSLAWLKPEALLINTARGALIDEPALAAALNAGRLGGAGLDVLGAEPPPPDHPLIGARHCLITPHIAWTGLGARQRLLETVTANLRAYLAGRPQNAVNRV